MSKFVGKGTIVRNASINGVDNKVLSFTVATKVNYDGHVKKDRNAFVPWRPLQPRRRKGGRID